MIGCSMPKNGSTWLTVRNQETEQQLRELSAEAEQRMVIGGYSETLRSAVWAVGQGSKIVPVLASLLDKRNTYREQGIGLTSAYPLNVLWALARVDSLINIFLLENYYASTGDNDAKLAIAGCKLRRTINDYDAGVLILTKAKLCNAPAHSALVLKSVEKGQQFKILEHAIENHDEKDEYGNSQLYDFVELYPSGGQGYIARKDSWFCPYI